MGKPIKNAAALPPSNSKEPRRLAAVTGSGFWMWTVKSLFPETKTRPEREVVAYYIARTFDEVRTEAERTHDDRVQLIGIKREVPILRILNADVMARPDGGPNT